MQVGSIHRDDMITVYHPNTIEEAIHLGQGTKWCTVARNKNMFDTYNKYGPMYIVVPKDPMYPGEKYQIHTSTIH